MIAAYINFVMNFLILFAIFINMVLFIAAIFKVKEYGLELLLLGMLSFGVLFGIHEFAQLIVTSYQLAGAEAPLGDALISEMFLLMASMLIFGVGVTKNKLKNFGLGRKK